MSRTARYFCYLFVSISIVVVSLAAPTQAAVCTTPTQSSVTENGTTYTVQTFTTVATNCTWTIPTGVIGIEVVLVGGGGGAGYGSCGGGGGAGRVAVSNSVISVSPGDVVTLTIGSGGSGGYNTNQALWQRGTNGGATAITINGSTYTAVGGGSGGGTAPNKGNNSGTVPAAAQAAIPSFQTIISFFNCPPCTICCI